MYQNLKDQKERKLIKGKKESQKEKKMKEETIVCGRRERKEKNDFFRFSLRSTEIGPTVFIGARGKVHPRIESYAWVPKSRSFVKLHEVGNFPTWNISSLKTI